MRQTNQPFFVLLLCLFLCHCPAFTLWPDCPTHHKVYEFKTEKYRQRNLKAKRVMDTNAGLVDNVTRTHENNVMTTTSLVRDRYRRLLLGNLFAIIPCLLWDPYQVHAMDEMSTTAGELIRRSASNIPGYGPADVYYPSVFLGKWRATCTIVSWESNIATGDGSLPRIPSNYITRMQKLLPWTVQYDVRFIPIVGEMIGKSDSNYKVVADRQFNEESFYHAMVDDLTEKFDDTTNASLLYKIQNVAWTPSNPNILSTLYNDGSTREVKVTKRATNINNDDGIVSISEYRRITTTSPESRGIPYISGSRVLTKWKYFPVNNIVDGRNGSDNDFMEGIELVYSDGISSDPLATSGYNGQMTSSASHLVSKLRLRLEKIRSS